MARGHWQIVQARTENGGRGRAGEDGSVARRRAGSRSGRTAARAVGPDLYGVDIKETERGMVVIEVNDNPNLDHDVEDATGKDEVWTRVSTGSSSGSTRKGAPVGRALNPHDLPAGCCCALR